MANPADKETMTVGELIAFLKQGTMNGRWSMATPVFATWESVLAPVRAKNISIDREIDISFVCIDVENYLG